MDPAATRARLFRLHAFVVVMLAAVTTVVFLPSLRAGFVWWDDDTEVLRNPNIEGLSAQHVTWAFTNFEWVRRYQPLDWISWQINYSLGGRNPFGYHLGNVLEHIGCVILLYLVVFKLLEFWNGQQRTPAGAATLAFASAAGTLFWAIHPLRAEAVAWVTGRIYTQCALFLLGAFLCYLVSADGSRSARARRWIYGLSVLFFACALLSYAIVVGAAVVLLLLDFYPLRRIGPGSPAGWFSRAAGRVYLEKVPYLLVALAVGLVTLWARVHVTGMWTPPPTLAEFPLYSRIMQACYTWAYYLWIPWEPFHLAPVYTRLVHFDPNGAEFWGSLLLVVVVSGVALLLRRRAPGLIVLWGYHLLMLVPLLGLSEHPHYTSDRYGHMEGFLWAVLLGGVLVLAVTRFRETLISKLVPFAAGVCIIAFGLVCWGQVGIWYDTESLLQYTLTQLGSDPYSADIHRRLGDFYSANRRLDEAVQQYDAALDVAPTYEKALRGKAMALMMMNGMPAAPASQP